MIHLTTSFSGGQLGRELANDAEECGYAFQAMIEDAPDDLGGDIAELSSDPAEIVQFLRLLADKIEAGIAKMLDED